MTAGDEYTTVAVALTGTATQYTVSGITAYSGGGLQRGETLYYGNEDNVSLTLSNTGAPEGYQYNGYTASAGTLEGSTLTMPDEDVTVSLALAVLPWTGDGSKGNPYIIYNKDQLDLLAQRVNSGSGDDFAATGYNGKYFKLNNDISYPHTSAWNAFTSTESNYEAIGSYYRSFSGHFDGNNKIISGIRIYKDGNDDADYYQGIFGRTNSSAVIHDLTLADARITGYDRTGGIVGYNYDGTVTRCHVAGDVAVCAMQSGAWYHGGIVGQNYRGTIEQCTSAATLTTANATNSRYYGGIAGYNEYGTLRDNLAIGATVPAVAYKYYGAITGYNGGTLRRNYYAACKVNDTPNATGVGCGYIGNADDGYTTADVTDDNGAVSIHTLTLADGITTTTPVTVTIGSTGYYAQGTNIALSYSGTPTGYQYGYTASAGTINGSTLTMPAEDVTVSVNTAVLRSTGVAVEVSYVDAGGTPQTAQAIALDGTETDLGTDGNETWYFVGTDIAFDHRLTLDGNVHLILADGCTMNVTSDTNGINVNGSLTIYGQTDGTGTVTATGVNGITTYSGTINISGGTVTATGGDGITTYRGTITISGGTVTATGGDGIYTNSGNITISGGTVTATGGYEGISTDSGNITISGGRVTVTGENDPGIYTKSGTITISGGTVTVTGGNYGIHSVSGDITISGGSVTVTGENAAGIYTNSGTITLGCTTASDFIYASSYFVGLERRLNIADGQTLFDEDGTPYCGDAVIIPDGKTLRLSPDIALTAREAPDGNYWTTYYNSFLGFTIDADENACAYTATYGGSQLTLHKLGKEIPAGTAVIIVAENGVVSMTAATDLPAYSGTNNLRGVDVDTDVDDIRSDLGEGTLYVLGMTTVNNEQHFGFHRYTGTDMAAHKAFVHVAGSPSQSAARSLTMVFDDATGIVSAEANSSLFTLHSSLSTWFTLDGRRLQAKPTAPGIYVNNGKKVVIK